MATTWEQVRIKGENITPDLLIWRRYKRPAPRMLELMLDSNPAMTYALAAGPYIPVGMVVSIPIDSEILKGTPVQIKAVRLYGEI